ncbi:MAG: hypothetical protein K0Q43_1478 [Ramlibacter sp.]|jgi:hypothetical protein|nr:hypothetical protein [Ramlibacter sp.]MDF2463243.1 hypothetical protein [Ramlibacter sp.]
MPGGIPQDRFQTWVGREESRVDRVDPVRMAALAAILDSPDGACGQAGLPSAWHWEHTASTTTGPTQRVRKAIPTWSSTARCRPRYCWT